MRRLVVQLLLSSGLFTGAALAQSGGRFVPTSAAELAVAAQMVNDHAGADPAISASLEVWADLSEVMVSFPESPEAAEIRAGTSGLGIRYDATRKMLAAALAADIFAQDFNSSSILSQRAGVLLRTLLRLDLPDRALALIDAVDYAQRPSLRATAIDYFVAAGDLPRAKLAAGGDTALLDRVARRLLATAGPAAALQLLESLPYEKALGLKIATLATIAHGLDAASAVEADRNASADALARVKDIASGLAYADPDAIAALAGLGLGDMAMRIAKNSDLARLIIPAMLAGGHFTESKILALKHDSNSDTIADLTTIAAAEAIQGNLAETEATLALFDQAKITVDQRAIAFLRIGKIEDAIALSDGTNLEQRTWGQILAAVAARNGLTDAKSIAAEHSVNLDDDVMKLLAVGVGLNDSGAAIALAGDDANLLLKIADTLTVRGNYVGAQAVLTATLSAQAPSDRNPNDFTSDIQGRLFDIELKLGDVDAAGARLPEFWDNERLNRFLAVALKAGLFDQAELAVGRMQTSSLDNEPDQTDGWWQVAVALAAQQGTEAARKLLNERLHIDPTSNLSLWVDVLAAARDRFALIDTLKKDADADPADRAILEIVILNLL